MKPKPNTMEKTYKNFLDEALYQYSLQATSTRVPAFEAICEQAAEAYAAYCVGEKEKEMQKIIEDLKEQIDELRIQKSMNL